MEIGCDYEMVFCFSSRAEADSQKPSEFAIALFGTSLSDVGRNGHNRADELIPYDRGSCPCHFVARLNRIDCEFPRFLPDIEFLKICHGPTMAPHLFQGVITLKHPLLEIRFPGLKPRANTPKPFQG